MSGYYLHFSVNYFVLGDIVINVQSNECYTYSDQNVLMLKGLHDRVALMHSYNM